MLLRLLANNTNKQWEIEGLNYISLALFVAFFASFDISFFLFQKFVTNYWNYGFYSEFVKANGFDFFLQKYIENDNTMNIF